MLDPSILPVISVGNDIIFLQIDHRPSNLQHELATPLAIPRPALYCLPAGNGGCYIEGLLLGALDFDPHVDCPTSCATQFSKRLFTYTQSFKQQY